MEKNGCKERGGKYIKIEKGGQEVKRFRNERERCKEKDEFVYIFI